MSYIVVDAQDVLGPFFRRESYRNTSLRFAPPPWVSTFAAEQFGRPRIVRTFITLDEFWDYRDGAYHPNYLIGVNRYDDDDAIHWYDRHRSQPSDVRFAEYLQSVSANADELLLCFRRYEHEAINGVIGFDTYSQVLKEAIRHCKRLAPNLRYVEVLNEWGCVHFGGLDDDQYYRFYRAAYTIVNDLNRELQPLIPLQVGGPTTATAHFAQVEQFLKRYGADPSPGKRLDFISFHDYSSGERPVRVRELRRQLDQWLTACRLPIDIPAFVTEVGAYEGPKMPNRADANRYNAAGMCTLLEQWRCCHDTIIFPWCQYHNPDKQFWSTQILPDRVLTSHGQAMRLLSMHRRLELKAESDGIDEQGMGVYALSSRDENAVVVQAWNFAPRPAVARLDVRIPRGLRDVSLRVREYRINSTHTISTPHDRVCEPSHTLRFDIAFENYDVWEVVIEPNSHAPGLLEP
jgi:hypothetical protein